MNRLAILKRAVGTAKDAIDGVAALTEKRFEELQQLNDEDKAIIMLARELLEDANDDCTWEED